MSLQTVPLLEANCELGAVFIDNLMLSSAHRVLGGHYEVLREEPALQHSAIGPTLFGHDVLNLAALLEAIVCHERLYVNAAYMDRWSAQTEALVSDTLGDLVVGVEWTQEFQWQAESSVVTNPEWPRLSLPTTIAVIANSVARATHHGFNPTYDEHTRAEVRAGNLPELFTPYTERTRPFGAGMDLTVATGFYTTCSQILGIPYRPSLIRAEILETYLTDQLTTVRFNAGRVAFDLLERSFDKAASETFGQLVELNLVDMHAPAVLSAVMSKAQSASEFLPRAMELRESRSAESFRHWNAEFTQSIQNGNLKDAAKRYRELQDVVTRVNRSNGLEPTDVASMYLGWGPVSIGKAFNLPQRLQLPITFKRHAWFLQNLYGSLLIAGRWGERLNELLLPSMPSWFRRAVADEALDWSRIGACFRDRQRIIDRFS